MKNQTKQSEEDVNIVLTGGHAATTGFAAIQEIHSQKLPWRLFWIGSKYAVEGKKIITLEYKEMPKYGVVFLPLVMGRLQRRFTFWTIPSLLKIPIGFFHALLLLTKVRPAAVLSFGGFSSYPVVIASKILSIPVVIHEQTAAAGRANIAEAPFANKIALSREESSKYFPSEKIVITGNPVSEKMFSIKQKTNISDPPTIFITGGSRGSQSINEAVLDILKTLLEKYKIYHQTGELDFKKFAEVRKNLAGNLSKNYEIFATVEPEKIHEYYQKSDLIVSRSGANTVSEILAVKRPAIVVPLPISYLDEQTKNAKILVDSGFGKIIPQNRLSGDSLYESIMEIFSNYQKFVERINKFKSPDSGAAERLISLLKKCLK